jgi:xanthine/CO dehydrogenase XdhC/CoxF family maturation factor
MDELDDVLTPLSIWLKEKRKVAIATVISTWGSAPRPVGGQMAIDVNGEIIGSVSGGCIEGAVISEGILCANNALDSTSTTTGSVVVKGGVGIAKSVQICRNVWNILW